MQEGKCPRQLEARVQRLGAKRTKQVSQGMGVDRAVLGQTLFLGACPSMCLPWGPPNHPQTPRLRGGRSSLTSLF